MLQDTKITIFSDGGSRGNPGPAASAFVVYDGVNLIHKDSKYLGETTNNVAEYTAVLMAIEWISKNENYRDITFFLDSQLVVRQLTGLYKIKDVRLVKFAEQIKSLQRNHNIRIEWVHVMREKNKIADALVNEKLDNSSRH